MKYALVGSNLPYSMSKELHYALGNCSYSLLEVSSEELPVLLGKKKFIGLNVTIPYKEEVIRYLDRISPIARHTRAVNTVVNKNGVLCGYNTDYFGLAALIKKSGISFKDKKVLIFGSGATSRTAEVLMQALKVKSCKRVSRSGAEGCIGYRQAHGNCKSAEIIINTTPSGTYPHTDDEPQIDLRCFPKLCGVFDVVYNPFRSTLVCRAKELGIPAYGGTYMLCIQAAHSEARFGYIKRSIGEVNDVYRNLRADYQNVVLTGMPYTGKSSIGKLYAHIEKKRFFDTDEMISARFGCSVKEIFERYGEKAFRDAETEVIRSLQNERGCVIAVGGGALLRKENAEYLRKNGILVLLQRDLELQDPNSSRPLAQDKRSLLKLSLERSALYRKYADLTLNEKNMNVNECAKALYAELRTYEYTLI